MERAARRVVAASFVSAAVIGLVLVGCSADGSGGSIDDSTDQQPTEPSATLPAPSTPGSSSTAADEDTKPASKDAGPKTVDAGPPPPDPGTACANLDEIKTRPCGACGTQSTICQATGDGGAGKWSDYGACNGELAGGCIPGTVVNEACGMCGTVTKTCNKYCAYTSGACTGQPANACAPGNVDLSSAGCSDATTYRQRTCNATCTYGSFSASCAVPPTSIEVPVTPGQVTGTLVTFTAAKTTALLGGTCPTATTDTAKTTPYAYVTVHNPNAKAATVAVFNAQATGGAVIGTELAAYAGAGVPANRATCTVGVSTYGTTSLTGNFSFASLDGTRAVKIPAGGTVTIYDAAKTATSTGSVKLQVQLVSLE